jgi:hypothetical protein
VSQFHRHRPEDVGGPSDPWMRHEAYRRLLPPTEAEIEAVRDELEEPPLPRPRRTPSDAEIERSLPRATRRCLDCGVASGPCVCTREFAMWEAELEEREA